MNWHKQTTLIGMIMMSVTVLVLMGCANTAAAQTTATSTPRATIQQEDSTNIAADTEASVSVIGSGQAGARPDVAIVSLGVETQAEAADVALTQNSAQMHALIDALTGSGIAAEDIQTQGVQLFPRYDQALQPQADTSEPISYTALNTVEVRISDLGAVGELLDTAVAAGGNRVDSVRFDIEDATALIEQAREAAWSDARQKAEQLANLAGLELGDVLTISESNISTPIPLARSAAEAVSVPIEPGTQTIAVTIEVTWRLR